MAKKGKNNAPAKAKKNAGKQKVPAAAPETEPATASVGPVAGTLEASPDAIKPHVGEKVGKAHKKGKALAEQAINEQFNALEKTLLETNSGPKQPRQLRWALRSLDAAKDAALRHIRHNV